MRLALPLILCSGVVHADWTYRQDLNLMAVNRDYGDFYYGDAFVETFAGGKYMDGNFTVEGRVLLRSLQSMGNQFPDSFEFLNLTPPRRLLNLYAYWNDGASNQTVVDLSALNVGYGVGNWQFSVGRKPLGIGVLRAFPVWNRLYPVLPTLSGYMLMDNPDLADLRYQSGSWTVALFSVLAKFRDDQITAAELIHYGETLESHFLAAYWWKQPAAGYAGVVDALGATWRIESLFVASGDGKNAGHQVGLGTEVAFDDRFSGLMEYYHSSFGAKVESEYLFQAPTPFRTLLASDYIYPQLIWKASDLLTTQFGALVNLVDSSVLATSEFSYSLRDNMDVNAALRIPLGRRGQEFGKISHPVLPDALFTYARWASVSLRLTF